MFLYPDQLKNYFVKNKVQKHYREGLKRSENADQDGALEKYSQALSILKGTNASSEKINNLHSEILYQRSEITKKMGDINRAEADLKKAISLAPDNEILLYSMGWVKMEQQNYEEALKYFESALDLNPLSIDGFFFKGICYQKLNKFQEAINSFQTLLKIRPNDFEALYKISTIFEEMKDFEKAIESYNVTISIKEDFALAYTGRGKCYMELGKSEDALKDFAKAKELGYKNDSNNSEELYSMVKFP